MTPFRSSMFFFSASTAGAAGPSVTPVNEEHSHSLQLKHYIKKSTRRNNMDLFFLYSSLCKNIIRPFRKLPDYMFGFADNFRDWLGLFVTNDTVLHSLLIK